MVAPATQPPNRCRILLPPLQSATDYPGLHHDKNARGSRWRLRARKHAYAVLVRNPRPALADQGRLLVVGFAGKGVVGGGEDLGEQPPDVAAPRGVVLGMVSECHEDGSDGVGGSSADVLRDRSESNLLG